MTKSEPHGRAAGAERPQRVHWRRSADRARRAFWGMAHRLEADAPIMLEIRNLVATGAEGPLPARLYVPFAAGVTSPLLVYFHGGGFVFGGLESHEMLCRRLADAARMRVLSVSYRLAPEHKWPAAPDDAVAALRWARANAKALNADPARIAVGGDSAGGNLAAVAALALRRETAAPKAQLLIYPCTQLVTMTPSQIRLREGYRITQAAQDWFQDAYLPNREAASDWRVSPLLADDFSGLPPALIVTAGFDPLLDEGKAYADKLAASGVPTTYREHQAQAHGFFNFTAVSSAAKTAIDECGLWLAQTMKRKRAG